MKARQTPNSASGPAGRLRRRLQPVVALFTGGFTPHKVSLCVVLGAGISLFPVLGTTTLLCTALAVALRLNLPAIQAVNWLFAGVQLALILPFMRLGERIYGAQPLPLSAAELADLFRAGWLDAVRTLGGSLAHAVSGWAIVCVPLGLLTYHLLRRALDRKRRRASE